MMAVPVPSISCCVLNEHDLFYQIENALAFNWDRCCHLALCLRFLPFHWNEASKSPFRTPSSWRVRERQHVLLGQPLQPEDALVAGNRRSAVHAGPVIAGVVADFVVVVVLVVGSPVVVGTPNCWNLEVINTKGSFTLAMLSVITSAIMLATAALIYLPWPIEMILSVSRHPRWPMQVQ
jgi:hypothetical protein